MNWLRSRRNLCGCGRKSCRPIDGRRKMRHSPRQQVSRTFIYGFETSSTIIFRKDFFNSQPANEFAGVRRGEGLLVEFTNAPVILLNPDEIVFTPSPNELVSEYQIDSCSFACIRGALAFICVHLRESAANYSSCLPLVSGRNAAMIMAIRNAAAQNENAHARSFDCASLPIV